MRSRLVLATILVVDLVVLAGTVAFDRWYGAAGQDFAAMAWLKWPLLQLSLAREATFAAWWSGVVLGAAGAAFLAAAAAGAVAGRDVPVRRTACLGLVGVLLLGLSLDEVATVHERLLTRDTAGAARAFDGGGTWMAPVLPLGVLAALGARSIRGHRVSTTTWLGWAGALCLSTIGLQEQVEMTPVVAGPRPTWLLAVEEGTELLGSLLLLAAGLRTLEAGGPGALAALRGELLRRRWAVAVLAGALLVLLTAVAEARFDRVVRDDRMGLPQWWTGSIAAGALAVAAAVAGRHAGDRFAKLLLAAIAVGAGLLGVLHGVDGFAWAQAWTGDPDADPLLRAVIAAVIGLPALVLAARGRPRFGLAAAVAAGLVIAGAGAPGALEVGALAVAAALSADGLVRIARSPHPALAANGS